MEHTIQNSIEICTILLEFWKTNNFSYFSARRRVGPGNKPPYYHVLPFILPLSLYDTSSRWLHEVSKTQFCENRPQKIYNHNAWLFIQYYLSCGEIWRSIYLNRFLFHSNCSRVSVLWHEILESWIMLLYRFADIFRAFSLKKSVCFSGINYTIKVPRYSS